MTTPPPPPSPGPPRLPGTTKGWPRTIGIIFLVLGILGIGSSLMGQVSYQVMTLTMKALENRGANPDRIAVYLEELKDLSTLSSIAQFITGGVLIWGAAFLLKQKRAASPILQLWAVAQITAGSCLNFRNLELTRAQLEIQSSANAIEESAAAVTGPLLSTVANMAAVGSFLWLLAPPLFLLVWLNRPKIREQVRSW